MGLFESMGASLSRFFTGQRANTPMEQASGGGVVNSGGFVVTAERNPKMQAQARHATYQDQLANCDAAAVGTRALLWLIGDVEWEVESSDKAKARRFTPNPEDMQRPIAPGAAQGAFKPGAMKPTGGGPPKPPPGPKGGSPFGKGGYWEVGKLAPGRPLSSTEDTPKTSDDFVEWVYDVLFEKLKTPWPRLTRRVATYRPHGFSLHEWVGIRRDDGTYGLRDLVEVPQTTITGWDQDVKADGTPGTMEFRGAIQTSPQDSKEVWIARKKLLYVVDDALAQGDPAGMGLMRPASDKIRQLQRLEQLEGLGYETDLRGIPVAYAPIAELRAQIGKQKPGGGVYTEADVTTALGPLTCFMEDHVRTKATGLTLDSSTYRDRGETSSPSAQRQWQVELMTTDASPLEALSAAIARKHLEIARVFAADVFLLGSGDGSQALSIEKAKMFASLCNATLTDIARAIEQDIIDVLWEWNRFDPKLKPKLRPGRVDLEDVKALADAMASWARAALPPDDPATPAFRRRLRLPVQSPEQVQREILSQQQAAMQQDAQAQADVAATHANIGATDAKTQATLNPPPRPVTPGAKPSTTKKPPLGGK